MRQRRPRLIERRRRIAEGVGRPLADDVFVGRAGDGGAVGVDGDGQGDRGVEVGGAGAGAAVPPAPHQRVAARQEKRVREHLGAGHRAWIVAAGAAIQRRMRLAAAIGRLVHHLVVAAAQILRLEDVEIERVLDHAVLVSRRELDVHDHRVPGIARVELAERPADQLFVLSHAGKGVTAEGRRFPHRELDPDHAGRRGRHDRECAHRRQHGHDGPTPDPRLPRPSARRSAQWGIRGGGRPWQDCGRHAVQHSHGDRAYPWYTRASADR